MSKIISLEERRKVYSKSMSSSQCEDKLRDKMMCEAQRDHDKVELQKKDQEWVEAGDALLTELGKHKDQAYYFWQALKRKVKGGSNEVS